MSTLLENLKASLASAKSYDNYEFRINRLAMLIGRPIEYILYHPQEAYPKIKDAYPNINSRKNMMTPILSLFRVNPKLQESDEGKKSWEEWKRYHDDMTTLQTVRVKKNKMPEKVKEKYTSMEDIELKVRELRKEDPHATMTKSQRFLLLTLLTDIKPKRSDLGAVRIYREKDPNKKKDNYIVLREKVGDPTYLVLNSYKTKKYYGRVEEDLSKESVNVLKQSLRRYPREYLFVDKSNAPFKSNDSYGKFVVRTFEEYFGKAMGTSLFRHVYVIEKENPDATEEELEESAKLMLHSSKVHRNYKWVDRGEMQCVCKPK